MFFALLILFFVIFLLTPLSALSRDFVSYSLVVTCNYVITSTSILFKALFYSKVVNNWRRSLTETFSLNFLSFLRQKLSILAFFKLSLSRSLSLYIYLYIHIYIYIYKYAHAFLYIHIFTHTQVGTGNHLVYPQILGLWRVKRIITSSALLPTLATWKRPLNYRGKGSLINVGWPW